MEEGVELEGDVGEESYPVGHCRCTDGLRAGRIEEFSEDEEEELDTTMQQHRAGKDVQGIPWERLRRSRKSYRESRLAEYRNYMNLLDEASPELALLRSEGCKHADPCEEFFRFSHNSRAVQSHIVHFQLRNLVWATSRNDIFVVFDNTVNHWNPITRKITPIMCLAGGANGPPVPRVGHLQVSTLSVGAGLVVAGGFNGEVVAKQLSAPQGRYLYCGRVTTSENGITNGLEIFASSRHPTRVMASNNDGLVRVFDAEGFKPVLSFEFPFAVNFSTFRPDVGDLIAIVGDDTGTCLVDASTGRTVAHLKGHKDFSFAAAWHPNGSLLATGNQDTTALVWDVRYTGKPLVCLPGRMGAIRSLRFSSDGRFLAMAEPADFVHVYDVAGGFDTYQELDIFGEIAGVSFTPDGESLFVGIADIAYSSLLTFDRLSDQEADGGLPGWQGAD